MITGKLLGIMSVALSGLLFYVSIYVLGSLGALSYMTLMLYVGLILTVVLFILILMVTSGRIEDSPVSDPPASHGPDGHSPLGSRQEQPFG